MNRNVPSETGRQSEAIRQASNALTAELLATDLELALTFVKVAEETESTAHARLALGKAQRGYDTVSRFLDRVLLDAAQQQVIDERRSRLQHRLAAMKSRLHLV
jgi:uncharacterized membrane-anchored protein